MADTPTAWRDKYLNALDTQEQLEQQFSGQQDLLRRCLIHLSASVEGQDGELDAALTQLKEGLRTSASADLAAQLEKVERHLVRLESFQGDQRARLLEVLYHCCQELKSLNIPSALRQRIHHLASRLQEHNRGYSQTLSALESWRQLLTEALDAAAAPELSFWQRLRGGRRLTAEAHPDAPPEQPPQASPTEKFYHSLPPAPVAASVEPDLQLEAKPANTPNVPAEQQPVVEHISTVLHQLLDAINPTDAIRERIGEARARIEKGLGWEELAIALEDLRDILQQSHLALDSELSEYLERVNEDLAGITHNLGLAAATSSRVGDAGRMFGASLAGHITDINTTLQTSSDLPNLKREVEIHIAKIQGALQQFQQQQDHGLADELARLLGRLQTIELHAQRTRVMLEHERHRATHDSLTELPNREAYNQRIKLELQRFKRYGEGFSLAVCDIDHFKQFNDNFGHQVGDRVLKLVSKALAKRLRDVDFVARYGGEEFVIIMPHTPLINALQTLDKIRAAIASLAFRFRDEPVRICLSFGLTHVEKEDSLHNLFARADQALYQAKAAGRNCCKALPEDVLQAVTAEVTDA